MHLSKTLIRWNSHNEQCPGRVAVRFDQLGAIPEGEGVCREDDEEDSPNATTIHHTLTDTQRHGVKEVGLVPG